MSRFSVQEINGQGGRYRKFPSNFFCLILPKKLIGNSSVFQKSSGSQNFFWMREGISSFPVEFLLSHITEIFHWELFVVSENYWQREHFMNASRRSHFSVKVFCVSLYGKLSLGTHLFFSKKFLAGENLYG